jgi:hypothetical protein
MAELRECPDSGPLTRAFMNTPVPILHQFPAAMDDIRPEEECAQQCAMPCSPFIKWRRE